MGIKQSARKIETKQSRWVIKITVTIKLQKVKKRSQAIKKSL